MNNERYLFRGKRIDNGETVYGGYALDAADKPRIICKDSSGKGLVFHKVIPETVGMWSDITDKNGVKVFEGDTIRSYDSKGNEIIHIVVFDNEEARFALMPKNASQWDIPMRLTQRWVTEFEKEVIGSIHDNDKAVNP